VDTATFPAVDSLIGDSAGITATNTLADPLADSVSKKPLQTDSAWTFDPARPLAVQILRHHPYFNFSAKAVAVAPEMKIFHGKETLFYALLALVIVFALLKLAFAKYFNDLFKLFFRTTLKQRQIKDQLIQTPLPSLLVNVFYIATAGLYIDLMFEYAGQAPLEFWWLYLYACIGLAIIYLVKFIGLKVTGWLLNLKDAADSYIFIIFLVNKVIGVFLLPFIILLAFTDGLLYSTTVLLSWCGLGILFLYRFILAYSALRNQVKFNLFHFLLYLVAFELAPLLLIYRLLLLFVK
jgi:hypothetical protein